MSLLQQGKQGVLTVLYLFALMMSLFEPTEKRKWAKTSTLSYLGGRLKNSFLDPVGLSSLVQNIYLLTMEQSKYLWSNKTTLTILTLTLFCTLMACNASIQKKSAAHEFGDTIIGWGDQIVTTISEKMNNALTDFDTIKQIIDATIEEDCYTEECPAGKMPYSSFD